MGNDGTSPGIVTTVDRNLERLEKQVDKRVTRRPLWERIILPLVGLVLVVIGLVFLVTPIPLAILMIVGFPLLFCFHPRVERRARHWMAQRLERLRTWVKSWRRPR
jgi:Flp pilus assembly protein TadB